MQIDTPTERMEAIEARTNGHGRAASQPRPMRLLRPREAAVRLGISERETYRLAQVGELPTVKIGRSVRISESHLEDWIQARVRGGRS